MCSSHAHLGTEGIENLNVPQRTVHALVFLRFRIYNYDNCPKLFLFVGKTTAALLLIPGTLIPTQALGLVRQVIRASGVDILTESIKQNNSVNLSLKMCNKNLSVT